MHSGDRYVDCFYVCVDKCVFCMFKGSALWDLLTGHRPSQPLAARSCCANR